MSAEMGTAEPGEHQGLGGDQEAGKVERSRVQVEEGVEERE